MSPTQEELIERFIPFLDELCLHGDRETWLIIIAKIRRVMPKSLRKELKP